MMRSARLLSLLLVLSGCASLTAPPARFKILQVNDVYKIEGLEQGQAGGLARLRTLRQHLESDGTPVLLLHGGDALYPSVMSKYLDARPMIDVMNRLDGDSSAFDPALIVTFGNHEFDNKDPNVLLDRLRDSEFQWLSTNTFHCVGGGCDQPFPRVHDTILMDVAGVRIGLFGVLYPLQKPYAKSFDVKQAAAAAVASLRHRGARVIIAVTHEDMGDDVTLARDVPGIDLVIGGHDHVFMQRHVGDTWITKADADVKSAIVYDVTVPRRGAIRTTPVRVVVDSTIPKDERVDASVQHWIGELGSKLGGIRTLGVTKFLLEGIEPAVRGRETALGNLLADIARERMSTDIAFINGGGIRINDDIRPGPITNYDMEGIFFYNNDLVSFPMKGSDVLEALQNGVSRADAGDGRFLQVSGLSFRYHKEGDRYVVTDVKVGGQPLDPARTYTAATVSFIYESGADEDGFAMFSDARRPPLTARVPDFKKVTEDFIERAGTIDTHIDGRIVRE